MLRTYIHGSRRCKREPYATSVHVYLGVRRAYEGRPGRSVDYRAIVAVKKKKRVAHATRDLYLSCCRDDRERLAAADTRESRGLILCKCWRSWFNAGSHRAACLAAKPSLRRSRVAVSRTSVSRRGQHFCVFSIRQAVLRINFHASVAFTTLKSVICAHTRKNKGSRTSRLGENESGGCVISPCRS